MSFFRISAFIFSFILGFTQDELYAQELSHRKFDVENGIPGTEIYDIIQDDFGFLWISTDKGLCRYDGYEFKGYGLEVGIPDPVIFDFYKDSSGKIWATTASGQIFCFFGRNPQFKTYQYNSIIKENSFGRAPNGLHVSKNGTITVVFHNTLDYLQLSSDGNVLEKPKTNVTSAKLLVGELPLDGFKLMFITQAGSKNSGFAIGSKQSKYDKLEGIGSLRKESIYALDHQIRIKSSSLDTTLFRKKKIISLGLLENDVFWVGYLYGGAEVYTKKGELLQSYLTNHSVTQLFKDSQGNIWATTLEGSLFLFSNDSMSFLEETAGNHITSISEFPDRMVSFGTASGEVYSLNHYKKTLHNSSQSKYPARLVFDSIRNENYSVSNQLFRNNQLIKEKLFGNHLKIIQNRYLLTGIFNSTVYDLDNNCNKVNTLFGGMRINDVVEYQNKIFAGTSSGLAYCQSIRDSAFIKVLSDFNITTLTPKGNNILLGTKGHGIIWLNNHLETINKITINDGLTSNFISKIKQAPGGSLWVATNKGINILHIKGDNITEIIEIDSQDGLLSNEINDFAFINDTAWIATKKGLNFIPIKSIQSSDEKQQLYLSWDYCKVNGKNIEHKKIFHYDENSFSFGFSGIRLKGGDKITYSYKLIGSENQDWIPTKNKSVEIPSLQPGAYTLIIQASRTGDSQTIEEIQYNFEITPPYWKTWWFILICVLLILGLIILFFRIKVLTYNKDIVREILRQILRMLRRNEPTIKVRHKGNDVSIKTAEIGFIKTDGNYVEIHTKESKFLVRASFAKILADIPDRIEFIQIHRSYIVRLDNISEFGSKKVVVFNNELPIGRKYAKELKAVIEENKSGK